MDEIMGLIIWSGFGILVGSGAYFGACAEKNAPLQSMKMIWVVGLVFGLFISLFTISKLFLVGYALALALASVVAYHFASLAPRFGVKTAAFIAGCGSGLAAFLVIVIWLRIWPFPH